jgi:EmrB/QacA subfamily drug resistance transporter
LAQVSAIIHRKIIHDTMIIDVTKIFRNSTDLAERRRWIALVVVCLAQLMSVLDATIVNVALPSMQRSLHFSQANLTWVVNAYLISFGSFLLLGGRLGDLIGRRRVFLVGVSLFTVSSAVCGLANSQLLLVVARFVQGFGGAGASSAIMAIIATEFRQPSDRARAMSLYMFVVSSGGSLGLLAGGVLTQSLDWHWIFFINVPIGLLTFIAARRYVTENQGLGIGRDIDVAGSVLVTAAMMVGAYAIVTSSTYRWGTAHTLGFAGASLALLVAFVVVESRVKNPIMPLRIFRIEGLTATSLIRGVTIVGMFASFFIGVLYLQHIRGYTVLQTGFAFLPQTVGLAVMSSGITSRLVARFGPRRPLIVGLVATGTGLAVLTQVGTHSSYLALILPGYLLMGVGAGLAFMPLLTLAMANVPSPDAGMASGIINTSLQLSAALGVAVLGTISTARTHALSTGGTGHIAALLGGYHLAFAVAAGCVAVGLIAAFAFLRAPREHRVAAREVEVV